MIVTRARIELPDPRGVLREMCAHLVEHHAVVTEQAEETTVALDKSAARLRILDRALDIVVEAPDLAGAQAMKFAVASHIVEFSPPGVAATLRWSGDGAAPSLPPDFRLLTVAGVEQLTPHMRRIRFRGEDLARFDSMEALHVRLFIPPTHLKEPVWPVIGEDGLLRQPPPDQRPAVRKYTIREIDVAAGTLAIDFVLHDDAGPGADFAARVQTGDRIGMAGPGGRGLRSADHYLFLADETGLPAVARMLSRLPSDAKGLALIEVADAQEEQPIQAPTGVTVRWLHRNGLKPGAATLLQDAFAALDWPREDASHYIWAAMEHEGFRQVRAMARERLNADRDQHLIVSYWRNGLNEEQHVAEKKAAARAA